MVSACPQESDPRPKVADFISDKAVRSIAGLREEGLDMLMDIVRTEVLRQQPGSSVINVDRDFLSDHKVLFSRELAECFSGFSSEGNVAVFIKEDIPVANWQSALSSLGKNATVYYGSLACRQIPLCVKVN